ncbi:MAG: hypothetical protein JST42_14885, partial [Bacteroidetes bacterium]|nr:hypothetical protein [Bacteroidota bacterium]
MRKLYDRIFLRNAACLALILSPALSFAQVDAAMTAKIREEGLNHSQIPQIAHALTDVSGPRLTNSPGYHQAAAWIVKTLQGWGLKNAQTEAWGQFGYGWSAEKTYLAMRSPYYSPLIAYAAPWSGSTNGPVSASAFLVEKMDSAWVAAHAGEMKGRILVARAPDSVLAADFKPDATRYSDSGLANIQDTYMLTAAQLKSYMPIFQKRMSLRKMLAATGAAAV